MLRSTVQYLPSILLPRLAAFGVILAGAHLLPAAEFGYYALVVAIGEFVDASVSNWIRIALLRFGAGESDPPASFVRRMAAATGICATLAVGAAGVISLLLAPEDLIRVAAAAAAYVLAFSFLRFGICLNQVRDNRLAVSLIEGVRAAAYLAIVLLCMSETKDFLASSLAGSLLTLVAGSVACLWASRRFGVSSHAEVSVSRLIRLALPLIALGLLSQLVNSLDRAMLKAFQDATVFGIYAATVAMARSGFDIIAAAFNMGTFVRASRQVNSGREADAAEQLARQQAHLLAFALPAAAVLLASRELVAHVLFPPSYLAIFVSATPLIVVGVVALNIKNFVYDNVFHLKLRNLRQIPSLIVGVVAGSMTGLLLLPSDPTFGASAMFAAGAIASLMASVTLSRSILRIRMEVLPMAAAIGFALLGWLAAEVVREMLILPPSLLLCVLALAGMAVAGGSLLTTSALLAGSSPERPRVLHVISSFRVGGAERLVSDIAYYGNRGELFEHQVLIINNDVDPTLIAELEQRNITLSQVGRSPGSRNPKYLLASVLLFARIRPAIVHCHSTHALYWALLSSLLSWPTRYIRTVHAVEIIAKLKWHERVVHYVLTRPLVAISRTIAEEGRRSGFPTITIHNGIDLAPYRSGDRTIARVPTILSVGRLSIETKGHDVLLRAVAICAGQGIDLRLSYVGAEADTETGVRTQLEMSARELGISDKVQFLGNRHDVPDLLREADVFVLPSRKEGFGLALVEAMASGLPVISSDIDGPKEIVRHNIDGLLVTVGDAAKMADAIRQLLLDAHLRTRLSDAAPLRAADFTISKTVMRYHELYAQTSGKPKVEYGVRE